MRMRTASLAVLLLGTAVVSSSAGPRDFEPAVNTPFKKAPRPIIGALREPLEKLPQIENFHVVGHTIIPNPGQVIERGRNGALSLAPPCGYIGNRLGRRSGTGPIFGTPLMPPEIAIVDISDPRRPHVIGHLVTPLGGTTRELRAFPELATLFVQNFGAEEGGVPPVNNLMIYDITNCASPALRMTINLGSWEPHEFFVWRDRRTANRVLVYFSASSSEPWMRVFDVTDAIRGRVPTEVATFTMNPVLPASQPLTPDQFFDPDQFKFTTPPRAQNNTIHSMSLAPEGNLVHIAARHSGFYVLDSTNLANNVPCRKDNVTLDNDTNKDSSLCLRKINPDPDARIDWHPPVVATTHSANKVPGRPYVLVSDERNGTTTCPWSHGWIIDVTNAAHPKVVSPWMVPENLGENCFEGGPGDPALMREFSTHQILAFPNLFFQTWYSAGFRAWDISNPYLPSEVGVFVPKPEYPNVVEPFRNSPDVWTWPYPVLYNGLFYVVDENSGLFILRYTGQRHDELPQQGIFEGNAVH